MANKKPFGGYSINFKEVKDTTLGEVFGVKDIPPSEMTKKIWAFVKEKELSSKPEKAPLDKLREYWEYSDYDELDNSKFNVLLTNCGVSSKVLKESTAIFKLQEKKPKEFEKQIDVLYQTFIESKEVSKE